MSNDQHTNLPEDITPENPSLSPTGPLVNAMRIPSRRAGTTQTRDGTMMTKAEIRSGFAKLTPPPDCPWFRRAEEEDCYFGAVVVGDLMFDAGDDGLYCAASDMSFRLVYYALCVIAQGWLVELTRLVNDETATRDQRQAASEQHAACQRLADAAYKLTRSATMMSEHTYYNEATNTLDLTPLMIEHYPDGAPGFERHLYSDGPQWLYNRHCVCDIGARLALDIAQAAVAWFLKGKDCNHIFFYAPFVAWLGAYREALEVWQRERKGEEG